MTGLNNRARTDLILDGTVHGIRESELHDGTHAACGDTVITRRNDRRLLAGRGWVRNGDRWNVVGVRRDGSMLARRAGSSWGSSVLLPTEYVAEHVELGYAVTSFRAQGLTTDTAHVLVDSTMSRETLYVAMTRGRDANVAYVAVDKPDPSHDGPHPGQNDEVTGRSVLISVLQHVGAELSAHETIAVEQESWGTIAQLAAEYETIAAAAQRDRWAALVRTSGLSTEEAEDVIDSDAFGPLTAELRRAEANHHDLVSVLPRLVRARGFGDADDIAAVIRHRLIVATAQPAGSGRSRKAARLVAGLVPEAMGSVADDMRQALDERRDLITQRADAVLGKAIADDAQWIASLGEAPAAESGRGRWQLAARTIAAYRDRYAVTTPSPLGLRPEATAQRIDHARAEAALTEIRRMNAAAKGVQSHRGPSERTSEGRVL